MFHVEKAEQCDCKLIHHLAAQVWGPTYQAILSKEQLDYMFNWMYSVASLEQQMEKGHVFYILYEDENPLGYLSVEKEYEGLFHIQKIYIIPIAQGRGLGRLLINKAAEHALSHTHSETNFIELELNVNRYNKAVEFYKKMGFIIDREVDNDIGNQFFMNDYIMKRTRINVS